MLHEYFTWVCYMGMLPETGARTHKVKWGGTHRFNDTANAEAKHRVSLKAYGGKVRVRTDTQTEQDLLRVNQARHPGTHPDLYAPDPDPNLVILKSTYDINLP